MGILLMAHGGNKDWNAQVQSIATKVNETVPAEVAFGMAKRATLQEGINKLVARGVKEIVAVPLFVSSHSSVVESTEYLLGLRPVAPADLADFAGMNHDLRHEGGGPAEDAAEGVKPVKSPVPLRMTPALNRHPLVADILADRAVAMSKDPAHEAVILVAHGPNDDPHNVQWLADMSALAKLLKSRRRYARIEYVTVRDDAEEPVRSQATAEFRKLVEEAGKKRLHVLIVPLLLSYGGIENGVRKRLDGLEHIMSPQGLLPDSRIAQWVLESARSDTSRAGE